MDSLTSIFNSLFVDDRTKRRQYYLRQQQQKVAQYKKYIHHEPEPPKHEEVTSGEGKDYNLLEKELVENKEKELIENEINSKKNDLIELDKSVKKEETIDKIGEKVDMPIEKVNRDMEDNMNRNNDNYSISSIDMIPSYKISKMVIRSSDWVNKHFIISNIKFQNILDTLEFIIEKISKVKNIDDIYSTNFNVITYLENHKYFKQFILDHPTSYFNDLKIGSKLTPEIINNLKLSEKKNIIIFDFDLYDDLTYLDTFMNINDNTTSNKIQLIVLNSVYSETKNILNVLKSNNTLLIHEKERKSYERKFYNQFLRKLDFIDENDYYNIMNSKIVYKNKQLKYI